MILFRLEASLTWLPPSSLASISEFGPDHFLTDEVRWGVLQPLDPQLVDDFGNVPGTGEPVDADQLDSSLLSLPANDYSQGASQGVIRENPDFSIAQDVIGWADDSFNNGREKSYCLNFIQYP